MDFGEDLGLSYAREIEEERPSSLSWTDFQVPPFQGHYEDLTLFFVEDESNNIVPYNDTTFQKVASQLLWRQVPIQGVGRDAWTFFAPAPYRWMSLANLCATTRESTLSENQERLVHLWVWSVLKRRSEAQDLSPQALAYLPVEAADGTSLFCQSNVFEWVFWDQWRRQQVLWPWCLPTCLRYLKEGGDDREAVLDRARALIARFPPPSQIGTHHQHAPLMWGLVLLESTVRRLARNTDPKPHDIVPFAWRTSTSPPPLPEEEEEVFVVPLEGEEEEQRSDPQAVEWRWHTLRWSGHGTVSTFWDDCLAGSFWTIARQNAGCGWKNACLSLLEHFGEERLVLSAGRFPYLTEEKATVLSWRERFCLLYFEKQGFFPPLQLLLLVVPDPAESWAALMESSMQASRVLFQTAFDAPAYPLPCPFHTPDAELVLRSLFFASRELPRCHLPTQPMDDLARSLGVLTATTREERRAKTQELLREEVASLDGSFVRAAWTEWDTEGALHPDMCLRWLQASWDWGIAPSEIPTNQPVVQAAFTPYLPRGVPFGISLSPLQ